MTNELNKKILSDLTVHMKYAKFIPELNRRETWEELVTRNKEMHQKRYPELADQIQLNYKYVYDKKVLPSMRSLQFSGKPIEISPNRLYNCSYLPIDHTDSFSECMFLLLSGCGVGYSVQNHHVNQLKSVQIDYTIVVTYLLTILIALVSVCFSCYLAVELVTAFKNTI